MGRLPLGDQELEVLGFIAERAPISAREIAEGYGQEHSLAKTTVLTVVERLRKKGYLARWRRDGIYHYSPRVAQSELLQDLVRQFVQKTLGGSVSPVVAYLAEGHGLTNQDLNELQRLVEELKAQQKGPDDNDIAGEGADAKEGV
jgi:predicted transcriptional regulator